MLWPGRASRALTSPYRPGGCGWPVQPHSPDLDSRRAGVSGLGPDAPGLAPEARCRRSVAGSRWLLSRLAGLAPPGWCWPAVG